MQTNSRFVLLDMKDSSYTVYDGRSVLAKFFQKDEKNPEYQTAVEVEELRTWDYKDLA